jgi:hypothetical protein
MWKGGSRLAPEESLELTLAGSGGQQSDLSLSVC